MDTCTFSIPSVQHSEALGAAAGAALATPVFLLLLWILGRAWGALKGRITAYRAARRDARPRHLLPYAARVASFMYSVQEVRAARATLAGDRYFRALVKAHDALDQDEYAVTDDPRLPKEELSIALLSAFETLLVAVYRACTAGDTALVRLRGILTRHERELEAFERSARPPSPVAPKGGA